MSVSTVLLGTFTGGPGGGMDEEGPPSESEGLYTVQFDSASGEFVPGSLSLRAEVATSPSWVRWHPTLPVLYTNNESFEGDFGSVTAYGVGAGCLLSLRNRMSSEGTSPCFIGLHPAGTHLAVANYSVEPGSVAVFALDEEGSLAERTDWVQHQTATEPEIMAARTGRVDPADPTSVDESVPHAHSCIFDPTGRWLLVCDVGTDRVTVYAFDQREGTIAKHSEALVTPGGGARHVAMSEDSQFVYVNEEAGCRVHAFRWDGDAGSLTPLHPPLDTLPAGEGGEKGHTAECALGPDGTRLFVANRGSHVGRQCTIATFAVDTETGSLSALAQTPVGRHPRHFRVDPSGKWMLCVALHDNKVEVYELDAAGVPQPTGHALECPAPTHVLFAPPRLEAGGKL